MKNKQGNLKIYICIWDFYTTIQKSTFEKVNKKYLKLKSSATILNIELIKTKRDWDSITGKILISGIIINKDSNFINLLEYFLFSYKRFVNDFINVYFIKK